MYNVWIIKASGNVAHTTQAKAPDLKQMQEAVGGYIETVPGFTKFECSVGGSATRGKAFCNEDGISKGLPFNRSATEAWRKSMSSGNPQRMTLLGDVIFYAKAK